MPQQTEPPTKATVFIVDPDNDIRLSLVNLFHLSEVAALSFRSGAELLDSAELRVPSCLMGDPNKQIAHRLDVSEIMVKIHRSRMMKKMGAGSLVQLIKKLELVYGRARCP